MFKQLIVFILIQLLIANTIYNFGDVHGDYEKLLTLLQISKLISDPNQPKWEGGKNTLIQLGDVLDRGKNGTEALYLLRKLQKEAHFSGGKVIILLGNHVSKK